MPSLYEEFETVVAEGNESTKTNYEYVTGLDYEEEKINVIKYTDIRDLNFAKYYCHAITIIDTCKKQQLNIKEKLIDIFKGKKRIFVFNH